MLDVLKGTVSPSGKLADTIARHIEDYPSHRNYGDDLRNFYAEDIYVGYRYFETFAQADVQYPFGFGLSYTDFTRELLDQTETADDITFTINVTNVGTFHGKEVVQLYCAVPQGKLGKPARGLCGFAKTSCLQPGDSEILTIVCSKYYLASYDDSGITGNLYSYVLEAGAYNFISVIAYARQRLPLQ